MVSRSFTETQSLNLKQQEQRNTPFIGINLEQDQVHMWDLPAGQAKRVF